jgi:hypothetical protein
MRICGKIVFFALRNMLNLAYVGNLDVCNSYKVRVICLLGLSFQVHLPYKVLVIS